MQAARDDVAVWHINSQDDPKALLPQGDRLKRQNVLKSFFRSLVLAAGKASAAIAKATKDIISSDQRMCNDDQVPLQVSTQSMKKATVSGT
jgi:glycerate-2-kinase